MKEHQILFSSPMVRAILDGSKSQTRRVVKPQKLSGAHDIATIVSTSDSLSAFVRHFCPYGQPGDRLWVREPFCFDDEFTAGWYCTSTAERSLGNPNGRQWTPEFPEDWQPPAYGSPVRSIHMPRWASRITLEITGVRVERLQEISVSDAISEGVVETAPHLNGVGPCLEWCYAYEDLWRSINGHGSWDANPWVWCISFRRID